MMTLKLSPHTKAVITIALCLLGLVLIILFPDYVSLLFLTTFVVCMGCKFYYNLVFYFGGKDYDS